MRPEDLAAYVRRDWQAIASAKDEQWLEERRRRGVAWCLQIADELRRQAMQQRPDWPSAEEREADLASHVRVSRALRRVRRARGR